MVLVYPYDKVIYQAKGSYKYLYNVTSDVDVTRHPNAGIDITGPIDQVVVTLTRTKYTRTDTEETIDNRITLIKELRYRKHLESLGLSLPIIGGWYVQSRYPDIPLYINLNEIMDGTYDFITHLNRGDILIVYSDRCSSIESNLNTNLIINGNQNNGFNFFENTVVSQIIFIDKCVKNRVVYYDNKPANQCEKNGNILIIDTDADFFESDERILNLSDFLSKYAKVVMLVIYLLVFMIHLDKIDNKSKTEPSDIKYLQQFIKYIKEGGIPSLTSTSISETIIFLYENNIVKAIRMIKHYSSYGNKCKKLDTHVKLITCLLDTFDLPPLAQTPMAMPPSTKMFSSRSLPKLSFIQIDRAIYNSPSRTRRINDSITLRNSNRQNNLNTIRGIKTHNNTPKKGLSTAWSISNRGGGSRRRRPKKMNSRKKHLNKRTHKTINARTSKSNSK
jgi:hypothetical protein